METVAAAPEGKIYICPACGAKSGEQHYPDCSKPEPQLADKPADPA